MNVPDSGVTGDDAVVDAVLAASRVFVAVASSALAELEPQVTLPQFRTLVLLEQHEVMTVAELAEALRVARSTATRMCDRLVAKKLVRRVIDKSDRRQMNLSLRPDGQALITASTRRRRHGIAELLRSIPGDDRVRLAESLRMLVRAANQ